MIRAVFLSLLAALAAVSASAQSLRPDQARFRDIYRELVETNTTVSSGSCTLAAERMAARLQAAGFADSDLTVFSVPERPKDGGLVAVMTGSNPHLKAVLLLAHLDVVEAKREDWTRDPFTLVEEDGYFYGRGTADDKAQAAVWVDMLARFKTDKYKPRRSIKMALTCGEEGGPFNGARWLAQNRHDLIDAAFALNEGGWGRMDDSGRRIVMNVNAGERLPMNVRLEVTNSGGHAMRPVKDNAITRLSAALVKIGAHDFPLQTTDATRLFFARMEKVAGGEMGAAMAALARNPGDTAAAAVIARDPAYNAMMRTTCVATMLEAGHATNALPQRAAANVNCRIFPGGTPEGVRAALVDVISDPAVTVTAQPTRSAPVTTAPPLTDAIMKPVERAAAKLWPGVPVIPTLEIGATDAAFLTPVGIPTYGFTGMFFEPDGSRLHGQNERVRSHVVYEGRDFLTEVVKDYTR